jgi:tripartite-type tricarboxylate transporter receptor subunit TctC
VIPYPPGGPSDVSTRIVMAHAAQSLGQPVIFDNKAGASGMIGAEFVKNQPVDNHTFLTTTTAMLCITRHLQPIPFDPDKDFVTVARMATSLGAVAMNSRCCRHRLRKTPPICPRSTRAFPERKIYPPGFDTGAPGRSGR